MTWTIVTPRGTPDVHVYCDTCRRILIARKHSLAQAAVEQAVERHTCPEEK